MKRAIAIVAIAGCGGASAQAPLTVPVGTARAQLVAALRGHDYCATPGDHGQTETFPQCHQPGAEYGASWVVATYDESGQVTRLDRFEKFGDPDRLEDRFNALVAARTDRDGPPTDVAKAQLQAAVPLPPGIRTWVAFRDGDELVGLFLLDPRPPGYANLLEQVVEAAP